MSQEQLGSTNSREELLNKALVEKIASLEWELAQYKVECTLLQQEVQAWRNSDKNAKAQAKPKSTT
jgi:hypothetical protein